MNIVLPRLVEVNSVSYGCGQINENHMSCGRDIQHKINILTYWVYKYVVSVFTTFLGLFINPNT